MARDTEQFTDEALHAFALIHNYHKWIFEAFKPFIGKNVLEIGSGIGNISKYLLTSCEKLISVDISDVFLKHLKIDFPDVETYNFDVAGPEITKLAGRNIDTVVCFNVLEHVEDDTAALRNMHDLLLPGGKLLLFVPALRFLYGTLDKGISHYRRYGRKELESKLETTGFKIIRIRYSNYFGILGWFINGRILKRKNFPVLQPILFDRIVPFIAKFEKIVRLPFGMNLLAVASKQ